MATVDANILQYCFEKLKQKTDVILKVTAENMVGVGLPATSDIVNLHKHASKFAHFSKNFNNKKQNNKNDSFAAVPSPPTAPLEIRMTGANSIIIEWGQPESDGGSPLLGYNIAIRDLKKTMWMEVGRVTESIQKFNIKDLQENHEYLIRIYARNEIGSSEPLESDEPFKAVPCLGGFLLFCDFFDIRIIFIISSNSHYSSSYCLIIGRTCATPNINDMYHIYH